MTFKGWRSLPRLGLRWAARLAGLSRPRARVGPGAALSPMARYLASDRKPWTAGYLEYRQQFVADVLAAGQLMQVFRTGRPLPQGYGQRIDERVVEYPWVLAHLADQPGLLLDAGATLSYQFLLDLPLLSGRTTLVCSLTMDSEYVPRPNVWYLSADLRHAPLPDGALNNIVCISTLEHVGMDNMQVYSANERYRENRPQAYQLVMQEFERILAPGGRLYLTVPFGFPEKHGWLQQFDQPMLDDAINAFAGQVEKQTFFRYAADGWHLATMAECSTARYFDIHHQKEYDSDYAAAARAVACVILAKPVAGPALGSNA